VQLKVGNYTMKKYKCLIADLEMINKKWDKEIEDHHNSIQWIEFKNISIKNRNTRIVYMGVLNDEIITEATAIISEDDLDMQNKDKLVGNKTAYLTAFRTNKHYEGRGYFSKLYKYMENDLKIKGFQKLTLGVEPCEVRNMQIYFKWGYVNFIKTAFEIYPLENNADEPEKVMVNYYSKKL